MAVRPPPPIVSTLFVVLECLASKELETAVYYHTFGPVFALQSDAPKHAAVVVH